MIGVVACLRIAPASVIPSMPGIHTGRAGVIDCIARIIGSRHPGFAVRVVSPGFVGIDHARAVLADDPAQQSGADRRRCGLHGNAQLIGNMLRVSMRRALVQTSATVNNAWHVSGYSQSTMHLRDQACRADWTRVSECPWIWAKHNGGPVLLDYCELKSRLTGGYNCFIQAELCEETYRCQWRSGSGRYSRRSLGQRAAELYNELRDRWRMPCQPIDIIDQMHEVGCVRV